MFFCFLLTFLFHFFPALRFLFHPIHLTKNRLARQFYVLVEWSCELLEKYFILCHTTIDPAENNRSLVKDKKKKTLSNVSGEPEIKQCLLSFKVYFHFPICLAKIISF